MLIWDFASGLCAPRAPRADTETGPTIPDHHRTLRLHAQPDYVAELALLLGWATLFGSLVILLGFVVLTVVIILVVPREERARDAIRRDLSPVPGQGLPMAGEDSTLINVGSE